MVHVLDRGKLIGHALPPHRPGGRAGSLHEPTTVHQFRVVHGKYNYIIIYVPGHQVSFEARLLLTMGMRTL